MQYFNMSASAGILASWFLISLDTGCCGNPCTSTEVLSVGESQCSLPLAKVLLPTPTEEGVQRSNCSGDMP